MLKKWGHSELCKLKWTSLINNDTGLSHWATPLVRFTWSTSSPLPRCSRTSSHKGPYTSMLRCCECQSPNPQFWWKWPCIDVYIDVYRIGWPTSSPLPGCSATSCPVAAPPILLLLLLRPRQLASTPLPPPTYSTILSSRPTALDSPNWYWQFILPTYLDVLASISISWLCPSG